MTARKELVSDVHDVINTMVGSVDDLYTALMANNRKMVSEALSSLRALAGRSEALTDALVAAGRIDPGAVPYVSVPSHVGRMRKSLERLAVALGKKIEDDILFSDRAVSEIEYLLERTRDILVHAKDMVLARNTLIARHLEESEKAVERAADEYSTRHEERLIGGLCTPKASGLFLEMIDALKVIAWHAKEIARDLA